MPTIFTGTQPKRKAKNPSCIYSPEDPWKAQESLNFHSCVNNDATFSNFYDYLTISILLKVMFNIYYLSNTLNLLSF